MEYVYRNSDTGRFSTGCYLHTLTTQQRVDHVLVRHEHVRWRDVVRHYERQPMTACTGRTISSLPALPAATARRNAGSIL
jgi:hypothetical protein